MTRPLICFLACAAASGCRLLPTERMTGLAWQTPPVRAQASRNYPEMQSAALRGKDDFGICFSGGGNRSAVATLGQLRALHATGLLQCARYISAVSGGSWGSAPWVFLQDRSPGADERFLGKLVMPAELKAADLFEPPDPASFAASASESTIGLFHYFRRLGGDESYGKEIARIFLSRHGLDDPKRIPVYDPETMARMQAMNAHLTPDDFLVCREGRPYFIAGAALSRRDHFVFSPKNLYRSFEFTSSYSGARSYAEKSATRWRFDIPVGGGFADNTIYDGWPYTAKHQERNSYAVTVAKAAPFPWVGASSRLSLPDILGASGSAPTAALPSLANLLGFPEFQHFAPGNLPGMRTRELLHTDGGAVENLGVMPLLARGVKNLLVFSNTESPYIRGRLPEDIAYLFGAESTDGLLDGRADELAKINRVFADPKGEKRRALVASFDRALHRRTTLIHCDRYRVVEQPFHGIRGGGEVNVCWIILGPAGALEDPAARPGRFANATASAVPLEETSWFASISDPQVRADLAKESHRELKGFPHYKTFLNNGRNLIGLSPLQVNALAHYTSFSVARNADVIRQHLGLTTSTSTP